MENLKNNRDIPEYIIKTNSLETCHNLIRLQNNIKTANIAKNIIDSRKLFISLDTESYEKNHDYLTEVGWVIFDKTKKIIKKKHFIIQEYSAFHNGIYVEDNKYNYNFGESETKPLITVKNFLNEDLKSVNYIVGQGINNDISDLKKRGINLTEFKEINGTYKEKGIIDTQDLFAGYFHERPISLKKGLEKLSIPYQNLHNAGNYFFIDIENKKRRKR
ncbi:hypothetical protein BCR32DRAFT_303968 [Anaeromyces robustus]|uniref:Gfd2/YDR514C-like C-terminal domain-containing protein n=1 Tax=Anaeromyces robustus TaxID=1754192 RepID=A0A1Y1WT88_9FUNG|nr:hypothetical protein BCR32DRAFT_303968 [Anaeromyces robustus]|eukprot:ORX76354.1 hypothetical protein BCR32DRAFT_303968 [Anaeromyces robustus]